MADRDVYCGFAPVGHWEGVGNNHRRSFLSQSTDYAELIDVDNRVWKTVSSIGTIHVFSEGLMESKYTNVGYNNTVNIVGTGMDRV